MDNNGHIDVALVASLSTLRGIFKKLHVNGRSWWIAGDPLDALDIGWLRVGWGNRQCADPLNAAHFRIPVVRVARGVGDDRLLLLLDPGSIVAEEQGYFLTKRRFVRDSISDFDAFFTPLRKALVNQLNTGTE